MNYQGKKIFREEVQHGRYNIFLSESFESLKLTVTFVA